MANAIKITPYGGSDIYFDENEVHRTKIRLGKSIQIQTNQTQVPRCYDTTMIHQSVGFTKSHKLIIEIDVLHYSTSTKTDLDTLFAAGTSFDIYPCLIDDNTKHYSKTLIDPNYSELYFYGAQAARIITKLKFYRVY